MGQGLAPAAIWPPCSPRNYSLPALKALENRSKAKILLVYSVHIFRSITDLISAISLPGLLFTRSCKRCFPFSRASVPASYSFHSRDKYHPGSLAPCSAAGWGADTHGSSISISRLFPPAINWNTDPTEVISQAY